MSYNYNRYSLGSYPGSYTPGLYSSYGSSPSSVHSSGLGSGYSSRSGSTSSLSSIGSGHGHTYSGHHPTSSYTPYLRVCKLYFLIFVLTMQDFFFYWFFLLLFMYLWKGKGGGWHDMGLSIVIYRGERAPPKIEKKIVKLLFFTLTLPLQINFSHRAPLVEIFLTTLPLLPNLKSWIRPRYTPYLWIF